MRDSGTLPSNEGTQYRCFGLVMQPRREFGPPRLERFVPGFDFPTIEQPCMSKYSISIARRTVPCLS